ncbi:hypothetical protein G9A89_002988 [Geosiphon pyriformis]|nr:hypothetical protein G9A89_002988 [Geosiphon pyriformis]
MGTTFVLRGAHFCWFHLSSAVCAKCGKINHTSLSCASEMKPTSHMSLMLNDRFTVLEHSLVSLAECVDELAKRLETPGLTVSQLWMSAVGDPFITESKDRYSNE